MQAAATTPWQAAACGARADLLASRNDCSFHAAAACRPVQPPRSQAVHAAPSLLHLQQRQQRRLSSAVAPGSSPPQQQQRPPERQQQQQLQRRRSALEAAGWTRREVFNAPNALSMARLLSGPVIASWILDAQWSLALPALAVSGATDWADGYVARRFNQPSVIGSYLDPLADKVLICSVVGALGWSGTLPGPVVAIILGRDVVLVAGAFAARAKSLGWRWPGWAEFFRVDSAGASPTAAPGAAAPAPLVQPLYISKVNTVFQLVLVGTCILNSWLGWPGEAAVWGCSGATAGTTVLSLWAYARAYRQGRVLAPAPPVRGPN